MTAKLLMAVTKGGAGAAEQYTSKRAAELIYSIMREYVEPDMRDRVEAGRPIIGDWKPLLEGGFAIWTGSQWKDAPQ